VPKLIAMARIVANPAGSLGDLALLTEAEQAQLLQLGQGPAVPLPPLPVHRLIEAQAQAQPQAVAVVHGEQQLTYQALNAQANRLAAWLQAQGVGAEQVVGLLLGRSLARVVAVLGVLKAGGAYLPLDPRYPPERLAFMLADSQACLWLADAAGAAALAGVPTGDLPPGFAWEAVQAECAALPATDLPWTGQLSDLAYLIYTSGSTGRPKGTLLTQQGLLNMVVPQLPVWGLPAGGGRVLQFAAFSFDASVWEIFTALSAGGCLVLAGEDQVRDPAQLAQLLAQEHIQLALLPPTLVSLLPEVALPALTCLVVGGEACGGELAAGRCSGTFGMRV
jgi:non-ribosomal peptide synthetase component F